MAKRPAEGPSATPSTSASTSRKRPRTVGPQTALPVADEAWRHKMQRAKESVVLRAKMKKSYAKIKARELGGTPGEGDPNTSASTGVREPVGIHPDRQARLDEADAEEDGENGQGEHRRQQQQRQRQRQRPPPPGKTDVIRKAQLEAEERQAAAAARATEKAAKRTERMRMQKAMARARRVDDRSSGGGYSKTKLHKNKGSNDAVDTTGGRRKLGRESGVLLDKVRKMMQK